LNRIPSLQGVDSMSLEQKGIMGKAAGFGIPLWDVEKEKTDRRTV